MTSTTSEAELARARRRGPAAVCALALLPLCACAPGAGGSQTTAQEAEASYVAALEQAVPLAARTASATEVEAVGRWESCMGGWQFKGNGAIHVAAKGDEVPVDQVREALVDAGWIDHTQVEGHVSVDKSGLTLDLQRPNRAFRDLWAVAFHSRCRTMTGADQDFVEQRGDYTFSDLRP